MEIIIIKFHSLTWTKTKYIYEYPLIYLQVSKKKKKEDQPNEPLNLT